MNVIIMTVDGRIAVLVNIFPCESETYEPDKQRETNKIQFPGLQN